MQTTPRGCADPGGDGPPAPPRSEARSRRHRGRQGDDRDALIEQQRQRVEVQLRLLQAGAGPADGEVRAAGLAAECPITGRATEQSTQRGSGEAGGAPSASVEKRVQVSAHPAADNRGLANQEPGDSSVSKAGQPGDLLPG